VANEGCQRIGELSRDLDTVKAKDTRFLSAKDQGMAILLKAIFKRPFTLHDLEESSASLLARPPLPEELREAVARNVGRNGKSLIDWWRESYVLDLKAIAQNKSWSRQRATLLKIVLDQMVFRSIYTATKDVHRVEAWQHYVQDMDVFKPVSKQEWPGLVFQLWLTCLLTSSCLETIGMRLYGIDKLKELELDLFVSWAQDTRTLDVSMLDYALTLLDKQQDEDARFVAAFKDDEVTPLIAERFTLMHQMSELIANDRLNLDRVRQRMDELSARHKQIAQRAQSFGLPSSPG
jgi:hypothetical protein